MTRAPATQPKDWREIRRLLAWELHQQGWSQPRIAEATGGDPGRSQSMAEAQPRGWRGRSLAPPSGSWSAGSIDRRTICPNSCAHRSRSSRLRLSRRPLDDPAGRRSSEPGFRSLVSSGACQPFIAKALPGLARSEIKIPGQTNSSLIILRSGTVGFPMVNRLFFGKTAAGFNLRTQEKSTSRQSGSAFELRATRTLNQLIKSQLLYH